MARREIPFGSEDRDFLTHESTKPRPARRGGPSTVRQRSDEDDVSYHLRCLRHVLQNQPYYLTWVETLADEITRLRKENQELRAKQKK